VEPGPARAEPSPRRRGLALALCGGLALCGSPRFASAAPPDPDPNTGDPDTGEGRNALEWYDRGIELADEEDYVGAAEAFLRSFAIQPTAAALLNAAYAYEAGGRAREAVDAYRLYIDDPDAEAALQAQARASIDALMPELGVLKGLRFDPNHPPLRVTVAGIERDLDALPIVLDPGMIEIEVTNEDGELSSERYFVSAGESLVIDLRALLLPARTDPGPDLDLDLDPDPEGLDPAERTRLGSALRRHKSRERGFRIATWASVGVGAGAALSITVLGPLTQRQARLFAEDTCLDAPDNGICPELLGDPGAHANNFQLLQNATNIAIAVSASLALTALVLGLLEVHERRQIAFIELDLGMPGPDARLRLTPVALELSF